MADNNLRSDSIRELIAEESDSDVGLESDHASDIDYEEESGDSDDLPAADDDAPPSKWRKWSNNDVSFPEFLYPMGGSSGFKPPPGFDMHSEMQYFQLFFTDELFNELVKETNINAHDKIQKNTPLTQYSAWHSWEDVTLPEMKAFIGVVMNMGLNPKPTLEDYFSTNNLDFQPFFKSVFSRERFFQIFWALHLSPPVSTGPILGTLTRSGKVKRFLQYLEKKFQEYFVPSKTISMDESTIGFKGRVTFKVYNKDKPTKWGIKVFVVSDAVCGYVCALEPYMGSQYSSQLARPELLVTSRVVLSLIDKLKQAYGDIKGFQLFTDRYYTSIELARELYKMNVHFTGTVQRNRKELPNEVKNKPKLKKGDILSLRKDPTNDDPTYYHVLEWKDKRNVLMLSTIYDNETEIVKRIVKGGKEEIVIKPSMICRYNDYMGGVDLADHYIATYSFSRKSIRWWRKVFFWALEVAIVNAYILCNSNRPPGARRIKQRNFRKKLIENLVGNVRNKTSHKRGRSSMTDEHERLNGKLHIPEFLEANKSKDCIVCSNRTVPGERKRTRLYCKTCSTKPGLHPGNCFERYHTLKKYKL